MTTTSDSTAPVTQRKKRSFDESDGAATAATGRNDITSTSKTSSGGRDDRDERRMEINRIRAKEIRKRKKKMEEDMQKQIIQLTLENNKLRTQLKMQQAEISLLRNNQIDMTAANQKRQQQQYLVPDYREALLRSQGLLPNNSIGGLLNQHNNFNAGTAQGLTALNGGLASLPLVQQQAGSQMYSSVNPGQDPASLAGLSATPGLPGGNADLSSLLGGVNSFRNQTPISETSIGIEGSEDINERNLADLLANSTSNVKHSLLAKLQSEENIARNNDFLLPEKLLDTTSVKES